MGFQIILHNTLKLFLFHIFGKYTAEFLKVILENIQTLLNINNILRSAILLE